MFEYHFTITCKLLELAGELEEALVKEVPAGGHRSVHDLLFHLLATDRSWRLGLEVGSQPEWLKRESHADLASLRDLLDREEAAWDQYWTTLPEAGIEESVEISAGDGRVMPFPRWKVAHHLLLHGMQHHAEIAQLLSQYGKSPGDIDFIFYRG